MTQTDDDIQIQWEEPPSSGQGRPNQYRPIVEKLKANPGKSALIQTAPALKNSRLGSGQKALRDLGAKAITRTVELPEGETWADPRDGSTHRRVAKLYAYWPTAEELAADSKAG